MRTRGVKEKPTSAFSWNPQELPGTARRGGLETGSRVRVANAAANRHSALPILLSLWQFMGDLRLPSRQQHAMSKDLDADTKVRSRRNPRVVKRMDFSQEIQSDGRAVGGVLPSHPRSFGMSQEARI